jgi:SnoaL-like domain
MSPQEMREVILNWGEEILHKGNLDKFEDFIAPDYVRHTDPGGPVGGSDIVGADDTRQTIAAFRKVFPDARFTNDDMLMRQGRRPLDLHRDASGHFPGNSSDR